MLTLRCCSLTRNRTNYLSPLLIVAKTVFPSTFPSPNPAVFFSPATSASERNSNLNSKDAVLSFQGWFSVGHNALLDRIFQILSSQENQDDGDGGGGVAFPSSVDFALSQLGLRLSESFVLDVLYYGKNVLSCLKFFHWAGRQQGFYHTRATFNAIFKVLSRQESMALMLDFLENYTTKERHFHRVRFYDTLVIGYAIAGKPDVALQLFGRMRFMGLDLCEYAYHVLLNALVEEGCFEMVEVICKQIEMRGYENDVTHAIVAKSLCRQSRLDEAEAFLLGLVSKGRPMNGHIVASLVDELCRSGSFDRAEKMVEEFLQLGVVGMDYCYGVWIRDLVHAGKLDQALNFLQSKKFSHGYVPEASRYNALICRLLRENRLAEVFDLLVEMMEADISPDKLTMNAALCFFCKAGMVDVALELYNSRDNFGLSPNGTAYNYLVSTLCMIGSVDEAYHVLRNSIKEGHFPRRKTFSIISDALCREGKLEKMKELVIVALDRNFIPKGFSYENFISALCRVRRVDDGYVIHEQLKRLNIATTGETYRSLIHGFTNSGRGDIAARLAIEMQMKGYHPDRKTIRGVISCLCDKGDPDKHFFDFLEAQLSHCGSKCRIYNFFMYVLGRAKRPNLARELFEMMGRNGVIPNGSSYIVMLNCYLKNGRISDALYLFSDISKRGIFLTRLYNTMVVGLCKANNPLYAVELLHVMRSSGLVPTIECYEELILLLCWSHKFNTVLSLVNDMVKLGRPISSFIGNVLLVHAMKTRDLYRAWFRSRKTENWVNYFSLGELIGAFSGCIMMDDSVENLEHVISRCFPLDIYTYNLLLRKLSMNEIDLACDYFHRIRQKGFEPNKWTYDIMVHGLLKHGRRMEARRWADEMFRKGFDLCKSTKKFFC